MNQQRRVSSKLKQKYVYLQFRQTTGNKVSLRTDKEDGIET